MNDQNARAIKSIVDSYYDRQISITIGNDDFDTDNCVYDLSVIDVSAKILSFITPYPLPQ